MKAVIEKELCNPVNGEIVGPYYHLYTVDENGNKTFVKTFDGDIAAAAKEAERLTDINCIEYSYSQTPELFSSVLPSNVCPEINTIDDSEIVMFAADFADKCYNKFCDELITALDNIKNLYYNDVLYADGKEVGTYYQKWKAYKEIAERIRKERYLQMPNLDAEKFLKLKYEKRIEEDKVVDNLIPSEKIIGRKNITLAREELENIKRKLSVKIEELTNKAFCLGLTFTTQNDTKN